MKNRRDIGKVGVDLAKNVIQVFAVVESGQATMICIDEYPRRLSFPNSSSHLWSEQERAALQIPAHKRQALARQCVKEQIHLHGAELFWNCLKRGYCGVYRKMIPKHLQKNMAESVLGRMFASWTRSSRLIAPLEVCPASV